MAVCFLIWIEHSSENQPPPTDSIFFFNTSQTPCVHFLLPSSNSIYLCALNHLPLSPSAPISLSFQFEIDECQSQPCANGAICMDRNNSYICSCQSGWTGPRCESLLVPAHQNTSMKVTQSNVDWMSAYVLHQLSRAKTLSYDEMRISIGWWNHAYFLRNLQNLLLRKHRHDW